MKFCSATLDNGLEIVAECNASAHSIGLGFFVHAGSRDETDSTAGVSHFLEHMMFKGTPRRTADDVNRQFDEIGANYNAFTSEENTVYYASVLPEYQEPTIDLLADIMRPSLREDDFNMEKKVILEEIQMYADQPPFGMDDKIKELHYGCHPLARSVLGTTASIEALSVDDMRAYFLSRYNSRNMFVAAAGNVDFPALVEQVQERCGSWAPGESARDTPSTQSGSTFHHTARESAIQQYVLQLADAPAADDDRRFAAKLLATMFGDDSGSRLYWDLVDPGLVESACLGHFEYQGAGMFFTWISCEPDSAFENLQRITYLQQLAEQQGFTEQELLQAKSKLKARIVLGSERPRNRLFNVGGNWLQRREYRSITDDLEKVAAISLDEVHRVLEEFPLTRNTTATIGPFQQWPADS